MAWTRSPHPQRGRGTHRGAYSSHQRRSYAGRGWRPHLSQHRKERRVDRPIVVLPTTNPSWGGPLPGPPGVWSGTLCCDPVGCKSRQVPKPQFIQCVRASKRPAPPKEGGRFIYNRDCWRGPSSSLARPPPHFWRPDCFLLLGLVNHARRKY
jgi:hypothetical protein